MPEAELKELLEAGVHFGHQTRRWNPNMRRFIFGEMDGIHIIDLLQTEALLENARKFAGELATGGGTVLFVGTKKQARDTIQEWADRCKMPYVNKRWLGGLLTNFNTMSGRIARLHELNGWKEEGKLDLLPTKERMGMEAELAKLEFNLGGVRDMDRLPDAVFVADLKTEEIAVNEAARLRIPIIGLVDTNCDPTPVDFVIPGNDDAIRSCELVIGTIGKAVEDGSSSWRVQEEKRIAEEMERRKREEEERKKREEEEKARKEAEEAKQHEEETARKQAEKKAAEKAAQEKQAPQAQAAPAAGPVSDATPSPTGDGPASSPPTAPAAKEEAPAAEVKAPEAAEAQTEEKPSEETPAENAEPAAEEKAAESGEESK
jgi:small subunit ribosomal protein S2